MPLFRRRPLMRAAVIGGGAYHMGKRRAESQEQDAYQDQRIGDLENQQQAPAPAPAAAAAPAAAGGMSADALDRLQELAKLHEQGVLTDEEFAAQKQKILA
jgi:Short C-terminal domain